MLSALLYLQLTSLKNVVLTRLRRLRQPKYFFGAIVGAAYFWFFFFRPIGVGARAAQFGQAAGGLPATDFAEMAAALGALAMLAYATLAWVLPTEKPGLPFSEAEAAFLFPAPLSRRKLIHFKLLSSQSRILFTSLFFTLLTKRFGSLGGSAVTHAMGWWVILSVLSLHAAGAVLTLTRLMEGGVSVRRRRGAVLGLLALAVGVTVAWVWQDLRAPTDADMAGFNPLRSYVLTVLNGGAIDWLLWPCKLVLGPFLAKDMAGFLSALGPALLILGAHYFWVMRMNVAFEEASLGVAEKRGATIAAWRAGKRLPRRTPGKGRRPPFALAGPGRAELALLWKNLLAAPGWLNPRLFVVVAGLIVAGCLILEGQPEWRAMLRLVGIGAGVAGAYILLLGPQLARQDLRGDLPNIDILKTYPLAGWQVVLGGLLAPTAILSGLLWLALLAGGLAVHLRGGPAAGALGTQLTAWVCLVLIAPPLVALQLLVPNAATVLFPGWFQSGAARGGGIDVMGQRLIFMFGQLFVLLLAMLPAGLAALVLILAFKWLIGTAAAVVLAAVAVLVILVGELWCGVWLIGVRFEKIDLSAELRA